MNYEVNIVAQRFPLLFLVKRVESELQTVKLDIQDTVDMQSYFKQSYVVVNQSDTIRFVTDELKDHGDITHLNPDELYKSLYRPLSQSSFLKDLKPIIYFRGLWLDSLGWRKVKNRRGLLFGKTVNYKRVLKIPVEYFEDFDKSIEECYEDYVYSMKLSNLHYHYPFRAKMWKTNGEKTFDAFTFIFKSIDELKLIDETITEATQVDYIPNSNNMINWERDSRAVIDIDMLYDQYTKIKKYKEMLNISNSVYKIDIKDVEVSKDLKNPFNVVLGKDVVAIPREAIDVIRNDEEFLPFIAEKYKTEVIKNV